MLTFWPCPAAERPVNDRFEHIPVGLIQHSAPTCVTRGLDHASRVHPICALKTPEIGYTRFRVVHDSSQELFAKRMDCRVISAFTRVFQRAMPGNDEMGQDDRNVV